MFFSRRVVILIGFSCLSLFLVASGRLGRDPLSIETNQVVNKLKFQFHFIALLTKT